MEVKVSLKDLFERLRYFYDIPFRVLNVNPHSVIVQAEEEWGGEVETLTEPGQAQNREKKEP